MNPTIQTYFFLRLLFAIYPGFVKQWTGNYFLQKNELFQQSPQGVFTFCETKLDFLPCTLNTLRPIAEFARVNTPGFFQLNL
ncbi:hypothetical protein [Umezakia ovalisporum]|uniref:hypothetical protein n=1 Tax=Umezakia ovalisporum TaxID=75695 RepID=UPI0035BAC6BC